MQAALHLCANANLKRLRLEHPKCVELQDKRWTEIAEETAHDLSARRAQEGELLFTLARRVKASLLTAGEHERDPSRFFPLVLYFVDWLKEYQALPKNGVELDWNDEEQIGIGWNVVWEKVRFAEGEDLLSTALKLAKTNPPPLGMKDGKYRLLLSLAYHFQEIQGEKEIVLPVGDKLAAALGVQKRFVGTLVQQAINDGYLAVVCGHYDCKKGKARTFRFALVPQRS